MPDKGFEIPRNWTFENVEVAAGFDRHVREQLPFYDMATGAIAHIARHYVPQDGVVYDFGASTGNVGHAIERTLDERRATLIPVEASAEMCKLYRGPQRGHLHNADIRQIEFKPYDFGVCFLVLMFLPPIDRPAWIARARSSLRPGGALVVFDKFEAASGYAATVLWRLTLAGKVAAGVDPADIVAKELSLAGVQRPMRRVELGQGAIEWFRFGEFAGYLIEA